MTKYQTYQKLQNMNRDVAYVANIIMNWHTNPARKLKKLLQLVSDGADVKFSQFDMGILLVNGEPAKWSILN